MYKVPEFLLEKVRQIGYAEMDRQAAIRYLRMFLITTAIIFGIILCVVIKARAETIGTASWYSVASCKREGTWQKWGGKTASGEVFDDNKMVCASWDYPFGTLLRVVNRRNNRSVIVEVVDRGPAKRLYKKGRILDLGKVAFSKLDKLEEGIVNVKIEVINDRKRIER